MNGIQSIAAKGRYGDNHLLHVSDAEVQGLNALANQMYGRGLTTNPDTGLPEAFLFAPLIAPMLAGGLGIGGGALATGLLAGGLGVAEAAARDMDDPLQQGLMAGITAGAGSALGSSLQGAADAANVAAGTGGLEAAKNQALADAATTYGTQAGSQQTAMLAAQDAAFGTPAQQALADTATTYGTQFTSPQTAMLTSQETGIPVSGASGPFAGAQKAYEGAKAIVTGAPGAPTGEEFMKANRGAITGLGMGLAGQGALSAKQEMREQKEAKDEEKAAKRREIQDRIRQNYMNVGRQLPTGIGGQPIFTAAQGGIVGLNAGGFTGSTGYGMEPNRGNIVGYDSAGQPVYDRAPSFDGEGLMSEMGNATLRILGGPGAGEAAPAVVPQVQQAPGYNEFLAALQQGAGNQAAMASSGYTGQMPDAPAAPPEEQQMARGGYLETGGRVGDGMSDGIPALIDGSQPAALSDGEFVIPADVVSHLGNGSSDAGAQQLYAMMDRIRQARTGNKEQGKEINAKKHMPA